MQIVKVARSWLNTPFKHQGRIKHIGCDCLGLIMGLAKELFIVTKDGIPLIQLDQANYFLTADYKLLEQKLDTNLNLLKTPKIGALALFSVDNHPQHLGILSDHPQRKFGLIHANMQLEKVVEHGLLSKVYKSYHLEF